MIESISRPKGRVAWQGKTRPTQSTTNRSAAGPRRAMKRQKPAKICDFIEPHDVCDLSAYLSDDQLTALCCDIAANGLREPIVLHEGKIVDGWHRYQACLLVGVEPRTVEWDGTGGSVEGFVRIKNARSRHLPRRGGKS